MKDYNPEFLYLTTTGWKTGKAHEIEIWYAAHGDCYYLCAEHREQTHWVQNIEHQSMVSFWINGRMMRGTGRVVHTNSEPELLAEIRALFDHKYQWSDGLFVELCPDRP
jgi:hypothetical protein